MRIEMKVWDLNSVG